jgi:hypothetical protein
VPLLCPPQLPPQAKCITKIVPFSFGDFKLTIVNNVIEEDKRQANAKYLSVHKKLQYWYCIPVPGCQPLTYILSK